MIPGFTSNLELTRKLFGYTQAELAKKIGKTQNYYTLIETGRAKSRPVLKKLSSILKIDEGFLNSEHELPYVGSYPFQTDFYVFFLKESDRLSHEYIQNYIFGPSELIDITFFELTLPFPFERKLINKRPIVMMALRDDHDTVFLFRRQDRQPTKALEKEQEKSDKEVKVRGFSVTVIPQLEKGSRLLNIDLFLNRLNDLKGPDVFQKSVNISLELLLKIEKGSVTKNDILEYFPDEAFFQRLSEKHSKLAKSRLGNIQPPKKLNPPHLKH